MPNGIMNMPALRFQFGRTVKHLAQYRHIAGVLLKYGFTETADALNNRFRLHLRRRHWTRVPPELSRAEHLRLALEELGPTFVKLGQLLSTRPDLLSQVYIEQLERLQDKVAPVDYELIRAEVETQLGAKLEVLFTRFDPTPLAAGSIAQVHMAITREGDKVAVKVRRPGIVKTLHTQCEILEDLAGLVKNSLKPEETFDPVEMVRQFTATVTREADLANEMRNLQRFARNFAKDKTIHIARVYDQYCTSGVLTMEYIDGIKPTDVDALRTAGIDPSLLAHHGADFVLRQVFDFGLFHTDPHPGNFFVLRGGVLAPLDFGQVARLTPTARTLVGELVMAIVDNDAHRLVRAFRRCDLLGYSTDASALEADLQDMLETYHTQSLEQVRLGRMMVQTFDALRRHRVRPPPDFTMMLKSMMTIESLALRLDPNFRIMEHMKPYAQRLSLENVSPSRILRNTRSALRDTLELAARLPDDVTGIINKFSTGQFQMHVQHEHLDSLIKSLIRSSSLMSFALIIAGLVVGSSILVTQGQGTVLGLIGLRSLGTLGYVAALILGLWMLVTLIRSRHLH